MGGLVPLLHAPLAVAGIAALWVVKAGIGWFLLRRWRARRMR